VKEIGGILLELMLNQKYKFMLKRVIAFRCTFFCLWLCLSANACKAPDSDEIRLDKGVVLVGSSNLPPNSDVIITPDSLVVNSGDQVKLNLEFSLNEGWYTYWRDPGAFGLPTKFSVSLAEEGKQANIESSNLQYMANWPDPEVFDHGEGRQSFGYISPFEVSLDLKGQMLHKGENKLLTRVSWLECSKKLCIPREKTIQHAIIIAE
jgi:DsbC/DsbD-like thiol-disulfide interchange protein